MSNIFANGDKTVWQTIEASGVTDKRKDRYINTSLDGFEEAQTRSDDYLRLKKRKPMTIEYLPAKGAKWMSVTMYVNPERITFQTQKVKGKAITRGGVFYHHWGDDNGILTLSGTTGYSGMKGIEALEEVYYASGTVLRYRNFGPKGSPYRTDGAITSIVNPDVNKNPTSSSASSSTISRSFAASSQSGTTSVANSIANPNVGAYTSAVSALKDAMKIDSPSIIKQMQSQLSAAKTNKQINATYQQYLKDIQSLEKAKAANNNLSSLTAQIDSVLNAHSGANGLSSTLKTAQLASVVEQRDDMMNQYDKFIQFKQQAAARLAQYGKFDSLYLSYASSADLIAKTIGIPDNVKTMPVAQLPAEKARVMVDWNKLVNLKTQQEQTTYTNTGSLSALQKRIDQTASAYGFEKGLYADLYKKTMPFQKQATITDLRKLSSLLLGSYKNIVDNNAFLSNLQYARQDLQTFVDNFKSSNGRIPTADEYYSNAYSIMRAYNPDVSDNLTSAVAFQQTSFYSGDIDSLQNLASNKFLTNWADNVGSDYNGLKISDGTISKLSPPQAASIMDSGFSKFSGAYSSITREEDIEYQSQHLAQKMASAINTIINDVKDYEDSEVEYGDQLRDRGFKDIMDDVQDEWKPRRIFIYFDNRAYIGHFETFNYQRDAANPLLIRYELRFVVEKQIIGNSGN
jgi:hypothetical protein